MHCFTPAQIPQLHSTHALVEPQLSIVALELDGLVINFNRGTMLPQQVKAAPDLQKSRRNQASGAVGALPGAAVCVAVNR